MKIGTDTSKVKDRISRKPGEWKYVECEYDQKDRYFFQIHSCGNRLDEYLHSAIHSLCPNVWFNGNVVIY